VAALESAEGDGAVGFSAVLPDGPTALGHPANEDLFTGTPVRAATSWRVYLFWVKSSGMGLALLGSEG
jgi:hypothetical protein